MSPKSTIDWMSRRSSRSIRPSCSPASRYACATSPGVLLGVLGLFRDHDPGVAHRAQRRDQADQRERDRADGPLEQLEGRQQPDQHLLGIAPHHQQRQQVLEDDEKAGHRQQQHARVFHVVDSGQRREDDGGDGDDQAEKQADGHEQQHGIVQVGPKARRAAVALDGEAEGQPHQRREGGLDRPDIDRRKRQDHEQGNGHRPVPRGRRRLGCGGWRSIKPPSRPPRRRNRCSSRRMAPVSAS